MSSQWFFHDPLVNDSYLLRVNMIYQFRGRVRPIFGGPPELVFSLDPCRLMRTVAFFITGDVTRLRGGFPHGMS